jgi:apolipoprotein N-acyltransferase
MIGLVVFVWLWDSAPTAKSAGFRAWVWGVGHFAVGSYWIAEAFFVPPADFAPLGPPAVIGMAFGLAVFPALSAWFSKMLAQRWPSLGGRYRRLVLLAIAWTVMEWLRGHIFTGYPWNPLGHVWAFAPALLQSASVVGVYGLGTLSFLVLAAPAAGGRAALAAVLMVAVAAAAGGAVMTPLEITPANANLTSADPTRNAPPNASTGPLIRIVQPNIPQSEKWRPEARAAELSKLIDLSQRDGFDKLAAVVWPETAAPFIVQPRSRGLARLALAAPRGGYLLAGAARAEGDPRDGVWNSLLAVDSGGAVQARYDKVHLVPFGEYIPFHKEWPPVAGLIGRGSFEKGDGAITVALPGLPSFGPMICYEAIFPAAVVAPGERPAWLLNVTNDAWFGTSSGPYQHLASAQLRTVEEGLPMIRAANTGVSAVIDAFGRVIASLDMEQEGIIDHALPPPRAETLYARWHDWMLLALLTILVLIVASAGRQVPR